MNTLLLQTKDSVLWCKLNRPDVRNAFNPEMIEELSRIPESLNADVRAVALIGEGAVFSAGGDLGWMKRSLDLSREENQKDAERLAHMYQTLDRLPVPLVGLIHGAAMGGGVGLVSVCDYAIASQETLFSFSEVRLGIIPACISPFVLRKIGIGHARALFTTAERFGSQKAYDIGLIHQIVSGKEQLIAEGEKKLKEIIECGPNAIRIAKELIFDVTQISDTDEQLQTVAERLANVRVSSEGQEGLRAFLEKRKPKWNS